MAKHGLFVDGQCQVQPEAYWEFELKELEGTFTRGHILVVSSICKIKFLWASVCVRRCVCVHQLHTPPWSPFMSPNTRGLWPWPRVSTMWELVPAGGVNRPPDVIKIYTTGGKTHKHTQNCAHKHCTVLLNYTQRKWVSFSWFTQCHAPPLCHSRWFPKLGRRKDCSQE